jgi:hypothetical protein
VAISVTVVGDGGGGGGGGGVDPFVTVNPTTGIFSLKILSSFSVVATVILAIDEELPKKLELVIL